MDRLDIEQFDALVEYLRARGRIGSGERPQVRRLPGGVSNRVVLVERPSGEAWVLKQALERLRVEVEWYSDPERVHREALGLRCLFRLAPAGTIPEFLFEDHRHHLLAMRAVPRPHENWKSRLLAGALHRSHFEAFGTLLGTIHRGSHLQRDGLPEVLFDRTTFESLRVEPYFRFAASQLPRAADFLAGVIEEMELRRFTLVHGDYSPKNILLSHGRLVLVDHEVIHFGDPAFDVGFSLTHLLSKGNHLPQLRVEFAAGAVAFWQSYRRALGEGLHWTEDLESRVVRQTLACLIARVAGRSPLEYLDETDGSRQMTVACALTDDPPRRVHALIERFLGGL